MEPPKAQQSTRTEGFFNVSSGIKFSIQQPELVESGIGPPDSEESDEAPHRTGRAQLRHPVPRVMDSLRTVVMYLGWN